MRERRRRERRQRRRGAPAPGRSRRTQDDRGKSGKAEGEAITNPCILVEVLSGSTERDDRGWKFRDYRTLASLDEHVLVSHDVRTVDVDRRKASWERESFGPGERFEPHGASLSVDAIYDE